MKVALLGLEKDFDPNSGRGPAVYAYNLYKNLLQIKDLSTIKFATKIPSLLGSGDSFTGNALGFTLNNLLRNFQQFNIIHTLYFNLVFSPFKFRIPIITTVNDTREIVDIPSQKTNVEPTIYKKLVKHIGILALKSDHLICVSTQTREEIIKLGYSKNKISVVNLGLDKRFLIDKHSIKKVNREKFSVGYLGSFAENKNVDFIFDTAKILKNTVNFYLWGTKTQDYSRLLKITQKPITMKFMGFAPGEQLINIYDSFDVFTFPSLYEGFGLPILEAQSRGLPVIIYKYGKIPKEVRKYCFEAKSPEHMAQIIENLKENGYNEKLQKKATEYARSFTWEKCARETLEVYKRVLR
jgi:glycosyltransferase involved in cell wall biosynthesis